NDIDVLSPIPLELLEMLGEAGEADEEEEEVVRRDGEDIQSYIPPELHSIIIKSLVPGEHGSQDWHRVRKALGSLRCFRIFEVEATRLLFRDFVFRPHASPCEREGRPPFKFGALVNTLYMATIEYDDWGPKPEDSKPDGDVTDIYSTGHYRQQAVLHAKLRDEHLTNLQAKTCLPLLINLVNSMTKLQKAVLTNDRYMDKEYNRLCLRCTLPGCPYPSARHIRLGPGPEAGLWIAGWEHWQPLMSALRRSKSAIEELQDYSSRYCFAAVSQRSDRAFSKDGPSIVRIYSHSYSDPPVSPFSISSTSLSATTN
ncbi:MAG: hypothetical protein Q9169_006958, partial [Polycauliona sp. 2 TL-2023]